MDNYIYIYIISESMSWESRRPGLNQPGLNGGFGTFGGQLGKRWSWPGGWPGRIFIPCPLVIQRGNGTWTTNFFLARKSLINWLALKDLSIARFSYWTVWFKTCWLCFGTNQPGHALRIVITLTTTPPRWLGQQWAADHRGISRYIGR